MTAVSDPGSVTAKRGLLARIGAWILLLLRLFWLTVALLLFVTAFGLYKGWSTPRQWSDAFFLAATAHVMIAAVAMAGTSEDMTASAAVRYLVKGNVNDSHQQMFQSALRRETFGVRVGIGFLVTMLIAAVCLWV